MRHGKETIKQANELIEAMRKSDVPAFHIDVFGLTERNEIQDLCNLAKRYQSVQEAWCNLEMSDDLQSRYKAKEDGLERDIRGIASKFGLTVHFDGDPRGFTVKLHTPKGTVFNTWGGKESGYGIG